MADKQTVKVGDRITAKFHDSCNDYRAGNTFYVQGVEEDGGEPIVVFTDNVGDKRYRRVSEFTVEHAPAADATGKPAFKVGDRVRVIRDGSSPKGSGHGVNIGHTFTVRIDEDGGITDGEWFFYPDELSLCEELTPLTIETGKFYRTRDGRKVGPAYRHHDGWGMGSEGGKMWAKDGHRYFGNAPETDLIAEWVDEPSSNDNQPVAEQQAGTADLTITIGSDTTELEGGLDRVIAKLERIKALKAEIAA